MKTVRIYYNPRCSKCRATLALIEERGHNTEVIEYLKTPPTREELRTLLHKLGRQPLDIVRKGEDVYRELYALRALTAEDWLDALVEHPILIERPIVVRGDKAVVARPPEKALDLL